MRYILALTLLVLAGPVGAQDRKDPAGVIQELDAVNGTITMVVAESRKNPRVRTYNIFKSDIPVTDAQDRPLKLTDLQPDDRIYFKLMDEDVTAIRRAPPVLHGVLSKIDAPARTIVLTTPIGDRTFRLPESAKVLDGPEAIGLEELKPGGPVNVIFDGKSIVELRLGKNVLPLAKLSKGIGVIIDVAPERRSVQIVVNYAGMDQSVLRDLSFTKEPTFALLYMGRHHRDMELGELARGVKTHFWMNAATRKVVHLEIDMPVLGRRVVKSIDRQRRELVVDEPQGDRTLVLSKHVKVVTSEGAGRLDDVQEQSVIGCGLSPDRKSVEVIRLWAK